ncbi:MAG: hypothetical protein WKF97_12840 [Chitinophagaceae bacterium]
MGKLVDLDFSHNEEQNCSNCGMKESRNNDCCKDENKLLKIDRDQKAAVTAYQLTQFTSDAQIDVFFGPSTVYVTSLIEEYPLSNAPPRAQSLPLFIRNCVFRI